MTNCYWIEEQGAFEVCAEAADWVQFDASPPATIPGRTFVSQLRQHPVRAQSAYGNGLIVVACAYELGGSYSHETYTVFVSEDNGLTYGPCIEKFPWLDGVDDGYDGWVYHSADWTGYGTHISFDGTHFYVVSTTQNDMSGKLIAMRTSKSADGVNWTTITGTNGNYHADGASDSYNGNIWFIGDNYPSTHTSSGRYAAGHSNDDGLTWSYELIGIPADIWSGDNAEDHHSFISANSTGAHITALDSWDYGLKYFRPTSNTTWAAGVFLWDFNVYPWTPYVREGFGKIVASRVTPANIYVMAADENIEGGYLYMRFRRSTDGGVTWQAPTVPWEINHWDWEWFQSFNNVTDMCELSDGRLVIIFLVAESLPYPLPENYMLNYIVSSDNGVTFSPAVAVPNSTWPRYGGNTLSRRYWATAVGIDVLITVTVAQISGRTLLFRPQ